MSVIAIALSSCNSIPEKPAEFDGFYYIYKKIDGKICAGLRENFKSKGEKSGFLSLGRGYILIPPRYEKLEFMKIDESHIFIKAFTGEVFHLYDYRGSLLFDGRYLRDFKPINCDISCCMPGDGFVATTTEKDKVGNFKIIAWFDYNIKIEEIGSDIVLGVNGFFFKKDGKWAFTQLVMARKKGAYFEHEVKTPQKKIILPDKGYDCIYEVVNSQYPFVYYLIAEKDGQYDYYHSEKGLVKNKHKLVTPKLMQQPLKKNDRNKNGLLPVGRYGTENMGTIIVDVNSRNWY